jgi:hypothetical protein
MIIGPQTKNKRLLRTGPYASELWLAFKTFTKGKGKTMSKNMLSLAEIDGQTALELPERALLTTLDVNATVTASITSSSASSTTSNASNTNNPTVVIADLDNKH